MRYPNRRYGNPAEMAYYAQGMPLADLARQLRRSERSVRDWLSGRERVPWWVPEVLRLQAMEHAERMRQMNMAPVARRLGLVREATIIDFPAVRPAAPGDIVIPDLYTLPLFEQA